MTTDKDGKPLPPARLSAKLGDMHYSVTDASTQSKYTVAPVSSVTAPSSAETDATFNNAIVYSALSVINF